MKSASRLWLAFKALQELGLRSVGLYALYQFGLRTGHYQRQLSASLARLKEQNRGSYLNIHPCLPSLPNRDAMLEIIGNQVGRLYEQADEIVDGKVRLFGGQCVPLILTSPEPLADWTKYAVNNRMDGQDIKYIWEPGRFGWVCTLAMAYHLTHEERYAEAFWQHTERFFSSNPPYCGPQWSSAQEVAIRLVALGFALQVFALSRQATPEQLDFLAQAISTHAERIPTTMVYARSQNNNHLISEALGLYTASALLPEHPLAPKWHKLGWDWLQYAFLTQITPDGAYIQHSTNYHRLMLQAALWVFAVHDHAFSNEPIPPEIHTLLDASTRWLWKLVDPDTGRVPNLGHNDGAYILPLTVCPYHDYRPVIHAAAHRFLHENLVPHGAWNDMGGWLCSPQDQTQSGNGFDFWRASPTPKELTSQSPSIITNQKNGSWAMLRAAIFHSRPAHADQLHLDLWWRGLNLAQDAGTYLYNALIPWDNSLGSAFVHNTLVIDDQEFMLRAGRFLFLDWSQAKVIAVQTPPEGSIESLTVQHNGYQSIGVLHSRQVSTYADGHWEVIDRLDGQPGLKHSVRLHWLLPDWEYETHDTSEIQNLPGYDIRINSPFGWVSLKVGVSSSLENNRPVRAKSFQLVRAGKLLYGSGTVSPISGWTSPTYGDKIPALACIFEISQSLPISLKSEWILPYEI
jgi:Heparinase II/III N-terminus/Heparinase II/III-like protein